MKKIVIVLAVGLTACQQHQQSTPAVLTKAQFSALLVDMYLAESRAQLVSKPQDSIIKIFRPREKKILAAHGVSDSLLKSTYTYYYAHAKEFEEVYDRVIDTLVLREQQFYQKKYQGDDKKIKK